MVELSSSRLLPPRGDMDTLDWGDMPFTSRPPLPLLFTMAFFCPVIPEIFVKPPLPLLLPLFTYILMSTGTVRLPPEWLDPTLAPDDGTPAPAPAPFREEMPCMRGRCIEPYFILLPLGEEWDGGTAEVDLTDSSCSTAEEDPPPPIIPLPYDPTGLALRSFCS